MALTIDTADAARELGIEPQPVYLDGSRERFGWQKAVFDAWPNAEYGWRGTGITLTPPLVRDPMSLLSVTYRRNIDRRITRSPQNALRWVVAHELGHALQHALTPHFERAYNRAGGGETTNGHANNPFERSADRIANGIWPLIKINGHPAREARGWEVK